MSFRHYGKPVARSAGRSEMRHPGGELWAELVRSPGPLLRAMSRDTATVRCAFRAPPPSADRKQYLKKIGHALTARASGTGGGKPRHHWSWNRAEHPFRPMVLAISSPRSGVRG